MSNESRSGRLVAVGTSAGGVAALLAFARTLPAGFVLQQAQVHLAAGSHPVPDPQPRPLLRQVLRAGPAGDRVGVQRHGEPAELLHPLDADAAVGPFYGDHQCRRMGAVGVGPADVLHHGDWRRG